MNYSIFIMKSCTIIQGIAGKKQLTEQTHCNTHTTEKHTTMDKQKKQVNKQLGKKTQIDPVSPKIIQNPIRRGVEKKSENITKIKNRRRKGK